MRARLVLTAATLASFTAIPFTGAATTSTARPYGTTWVVNRAGNSVLGYAPNASGFAAPVAKIRGTATGLHAPSAVAVSPAGKLFVANAGTDSITEYAANATGNAAPIATIAGTKTGLDAPSSLVLSGGAIWVTNPDSNLVESFSQGEAGNVLPAETIAGHKTELDHPVALAVATEDFLGTNIVVVNNPAAGKPTLTVYSQPKRGNVAPALVTRGPKNHRLLSPTAIDHSGYATYWVADTGNNSVDELDIEALVPIHGPTFSTVRSQRFIAGSKTGIDQPAGLSHDALDRLVVANASDHTVRIFASGANGNSHPQQVVDGVGSASGSLSAAAVYGVRPGTPTNVKVHLHGTTARMSWRRPAVTGGGVAGYSVIALPGRASRAVLTSLGPLVVLLGGVSTTQTHVLRHIKLGHRYAFAVAAVNGFGTSRFSRPIKVVHVIPPSPPRHVKTTTNRHSILVRWKPAKQSGGARVHYRVRYAAACAPGTKACKTRTLTSSAHGLDLVRIQGLKRHTTYDIQVTAKNHKGASQPSKVVRATTK